MYNATPNAIIPVHNLDCILKTSNTFWVASNKTGTISLVFFLRTPNCPCNTSPTVN